MTNQLFINNEFIESQSNETMDVINPATGKIRYNYICD